MPSPLDPSLTIIIPAYNESATIACVLDAILKYNPDVHEIIVVDDGSRDSTAAVVTQYALGHPQVHLIRQPQNRGKTEALKTGFAASSGQIVIVQDADLEYDPADYAKMMKPVLDFGADVVMGSRFLAPDCTRVFYFWHLLGNRFITLLFNVMNNTTFTDIYSCYLMYRRNLVDGGRLKSSGWEQHAEILSTAVGNGKVFYEVPIGYHGRSYGEGKKIKAWHIIGVLAMIVRARLARLAG